MGEASEIINLRPGSPETASVTLYDYTCHFEWKVNGGSSEKWLLTLSEEDDQVICEIKRPNPPSYLFFTQFKATIEGAEFESEEVYDNSGLVLRDDVYKAGKNGIA